MKGENPIGCKLLQVFNYLQEKHTHTQSVVTQTKKVKEHEGTSYREYKWYMF